MSTDNSSEDKATQAGTGTSPFRTRRRRVTWFASLSLVAVAIIAIGVYAVVGLRTQSVGQSDVSVAEGHDLPRADLVLAQGEDQGLVQSYCTACHSLAPIVTHSGFTEEDWESEVTKMREQYGAPIDDATAKRIIAYLQTHYATDTEKPAGTSEYLFNDPAGNFDDSAEDR
ncbi:cytochrome c [Janibacter cremeus]|uniref:c-type cytochrome n=1 Tax=Janibacter cremeus TaxID=1285192 RepID=UPI0023F8A252|nr:cytochrome c [Janibacter cremeus]WEV78798.1 cytochrome c [Janibacter cremeus]